MLHFLIIINSNIFGMEKKITIKGEDFFYTLRSSKRARRLRLTFYNDGHLVLTKPFSVSYYLADSFLREKSDLIFNYLKNTISKNIEYKTPVARHLDYLKRKEEARVLVEKRLEYFNKFYKFSYNRVTIRKQRTRWGSCSRQGNLNFNYRILDLTKKEADYIIVHELCHLSEFNHSVRFWSLVAKILPDYNEIRRSLRIRFK